MKFNRYLSEHKKLIDKYLLLYIDQLINKSSNKLHFSEPVLNQIKEFVVRGKSIRGILTLLSAEMFGVKNPKTALGIASALELIHSSLLIHDDIMDNDLFRRGKPSIFSQYIPLAKKLGITSSFFSQSMGISVGNIALILGLQLLNRLKNYELTDFVLNEISVTNIAQMNDVFIGEKKELPTENEIINIYKYKTARYTFSLPLTAGAILAEKDEDTKQKLGLLGECIGIIFQLQDDNISLYSNIKQAGKQMGSDIINNKKTLLRILLYKNISNNEKTKLNTIFGNKKITFKEIKLIQKLCKKYHIDKRIENKKNKLKISALKIIEDFAIEVKYKKILTELLEFVSSRLQ